MPDFNIHRLLMDVFAPSPGETVLVMADLPHDSLEDTRNWQERREMAESWRQACRQLSAISRRSCQFRVSSRLS